jgi:HD-GYP domain-containing protein (c-di-GMP phosphodiesterase class II)
MRGWNDEKRWARNPSSFAPLQALDHFVQELQRCDQAGRQLRLLLKSIAESIEADVVFVQSAFESNVFEITGAYPLTDQWCRDLLVQMLEKNGADDTQLVAPEPSWHLRNMSPSSPVPCSVAMVQISKSRATWAVALSFTPGRAFRPLDLSLMGLARRLLVSHSRQLRAAEQVKETLLGLIHCLTAAIDAKDPYTCGHSERVARMAVRIAHAMRLPENSISDLYLAGLLHDIGKIGVRDVVLQKAGTLTDAEIEGGPHPSGHRRPNHLQCPPTRALRSGGAQPPRALRRHGLSGSLGGRTNPFNGSDSGCGRFLRCHVVGAPVPAPHPGAPG